MDTIFVTRCHRPSVGFVDGGEGFTGKTQYGVRGHSSASANAKCSHDVDVGGYHSGLFIPPRSYPIDRIKYI